MTMQHSTDYNATVATLGMGDRFQTSQHGAVVTVAWAAASVDGSVVYIRESDGSVVPMPTFRRIHVVERAPLCGCGRRFDYCDQGCVWPDHLEQLFMV